MEESGEKKGRSLTPDDIEAIREIGSTCPHGLTANDIFRLQEFLACWERAKSTVGGYVIKTFIILIIAIGVLVAWITNGGGRG